MQRLANPSTEKVNPVQAQKYLNQFAKYEGQRNLRSRLINYYVSEMKKEEFYATTLMFAKQRYNGGDFVIANGHHTLTSIVRANSPQWVTVEKWAVDSPADMDNLYAKFDNTGIRTLADFVKARASTNGVQWPLFVASAIVTAATYKEKKENVLYAGQKAAILDGYLKAGDFFNYLMNTSVPDGISKTRATKHLKRKPVYYAMLVTWEKCQSHAGVFWSRVRDGENLTRKMPEYHLSNFLREHNYGGSARGAVTQKTVSITEMASKCIIAWNAFRQQRSVNGLRYYPSKPMPRAV